MNSQQEAELAQAQLYKLKHGDAEATEYVPPAPAEGITIVDVRIPYVSLVVLFVKAVLALIPATVIILILVVIFNVITAGAILNLFQ